MFYHRPLFTLISLNELFRQQYEPHAAPYKDRIDCLRTLHDKGVKTWVSIEPYPTPNIIDQDFQEILEAVSFVDKIIFGKLNYNSTCKNIGSSMGRVVTISGEIEKPAGLIKKRNTIEAEISANINRPGEVGHVGEFIATISST